MYREEFIYSTELLIVNFCILSVKTAPEEPDGIENFLGVYVPQTTLDNSALCTEASTSSVSVQHQHPRCTTITSLIQLLNRSLKTLLISNSNFC